MGLLYFYGRRIAADKMSLSRFSWYWHRLRAMSPAEMGAHVRKRVYQFADARRTWDWERDRLKAGQQTGCFPKLPERGAAPERLREALRRDAEEVLAGRWRAFGHLALKVDDPPHWQMDYLAGKNLQTEESAFRLDHRELPNGADIRLVWELSRWSQLVRLAQAAYVFGEARFGDKCVAWLEDWVAHNPPYRGWNWTSALESGIRLVQFTWIDALLRNIEPQSQSGALQDLQWKILAPHACFTWRHKSFGSSANNHLLGELAGLILATARWPALEKECAPLGILQQMWEAEVLAQFAEDGGNREQALNYHLFSLEFCLQAQAALTSAGRTVSVNVENRLRLAAAFYVEVQSPGEVQSPKSKVQSPGSSADGTGETWDYGDSDSARVTPFFAQERTGALEWRDWLRDVENGSSIFYWLGAPPLRSRRSEIAAGAGRTAKGGAVFEASGIAVDDWNLWTLRLDVSPLGYLSTAAHGHLDALHLSVWYRGVAMIVDPGTGAYYADKQLRAYLSSWDAHNGPHPVGLNFPTRLGPFLWSKPHSAPIGHYRPGEVTGDLVLPVGRVRRRLLRVEEDRCWQVEDSYEPNPSWSGDFIVRWQFAPGSWVKRLDERRFALHRGEVSIMIEVGANWTEVNLVEALADTANHFDGIVSPAFRKTVFAPYLKLTGKAGKKSCVFRTTFLAS